MTYYHSKKEALEAEGLEYRLIKDSDGAVHSVGLEKRLWKGYDHITGWFHGQQYEGLQHITHEELCNRIAQSLENCAASDNPMTFALSFRQHVSWMYWNVTGQGTANA